jgi:hypothetical protein
MEISTIVKQIEIGDYFVSTVYMPLLSMFTSDCYETMAFKGGTGSNPSMSALCQYRSETLEEAISANDHICALIKLKIEKGEEVDSELFDGELDYGNILEN